MIAIDTNLLVHALRKDMPLHDAVRPCLRNLVESGGRWAIPWPCVHELMAVVSNPRIFPLPTPTAFVLEYLHYCSRSSGFHFIGEGPGYLACIEETLASSQVTGARVHDARVAAICLHHRVKELWTLDRDFSRFGKLNVRNPLAKK